MYWRPSCASCKADVSSYYSTITLWGMNTKVLSWGKGRQVMDNAVVDTAKYLTHIDCLHKSIQVSGPRSLTQDQRTNPPRDLPVKLDCFLVDPSESEHQQTLLFGWLTICQGLDCPFDLHHCHPVCQKAFIKYFRWFQTFMSIPDFKVRIAFTSK